MAGPSANEGAGWDAAGCVVRVRQGDESAAAEMLEQLGPLVLKLVRSHLPRRSSEDDLVQTVFMKVFSKLDGYSGTVPLEHWVSRIAVNTCIKQFHRERVRPELRYADLTEEQEEVLQSLASTAEELSVDRDLAARELVTQMLERLPAPDRLVITLLHLEGRSVAEVSQVTGWSATLVKVRAFRARRRMRKHLDVLLQETVR